MQRLIDTGAAGGGTRCRRRSGHPGGYSNRATPAAPNPRLGQRPRRTRHHGLGRALPRARSPPTWSASSARATWAAAVAGAALERRGPGRRGCGHRRERHARAGEGVPRLAARAGRRPPGYRWGLSTSAVPTDAVGRIMSRQLARDPGGEPGVMGSTTASLHGMQAGDVLELLERGQPARAACASASSRPTAPSAAPRCCMSPELFHALGFLRPTRVLMWGIPDREPARRRPGRQRPGALRRPDHPLVGPAQPRRHALHRDDQGAPRASSRTATPGAGPTSTRRRRGGAPTSPATPGPSAAARSTPGATASSTPRRAAALAEVSARGLAGAIDLANTNTYGGLLRAPRGAPGRGHHGRFGEPALVGPGHRHEHRRATAWAACPG